MCTHMCDGIFVAWKRNGNQGSRGSSTPDTTKSIKQGFWEFQVFFFFLSLLQSNSIGKKTLLFDNINGLTEREKEKFIVTRWKHCSNTHPHWAGLNLVGYQGAAKHSTQAQSQTMPFAKYRASPQCIDFLFILQPSYSILNEHNSSAIGGQSSESGKNKSPSM